MYIPLAQLALAKGRYLEFCVNIYKPAVVVPRFIPLCNNIYLYSPPPLIIQPFPFRLTYIVADFIADINMSTCSFPIRHCLPS